MRCTLCGGGRYGSEMMGMEGLGVVLVVVRGLVGGEKGGDVLPRAGMVG